MEFSRDSVQMQEEMIRDIASARPAMLVFVNTPHIMSFRSGAGKIVYDWLKDYSRSYRRVGIVDMYPGEPTVYRWGEAAAGQQPQSDMSITVFARE